MFVKLRSGELLCVDECCQILLAGLLEAAWDHGTPENDLAAVVISRGVCDTHPDAVQRGIDAAQAIIATGLRAAVAEDTTS